MSARNQVPSSGVGYEPTGVPNLDMVLGGGLPRGSLVLIMGLPGSGKTSLASHIAFNAACAGKQVLILTALSESTSKLAEHLQAFAFFDRELIGGPIQFLSLQNTLEAGLRAAGKMVVDEVRRVKADVVVLDGFRGMRSVEVEPQAAREFLYDLSTSLGTLQTTTLVTSETDPRDPAFFPETTTADVILGLHFTLLGVRQHRSIEVIKARGRAPLPGLHALTLSEEGASVYPQFEERIARDLLGAEAQTQGATRTTAEVPGHGTMQRVTFGLPELDAMLAGGIPKATCTLLAGSLGTGKTLLALYFALAGATAGERTVYLGFRESRAQLLQAAAPFPIGEGFERALRPDGRITFLGMPPIKVNPDILADRLLDEIDRTRAQRLVIDSIAELERGLLRSGDAQRLEDYLAALLLALRARGVTALLVKETDKALTATLDFSADPLSLLAENVLLLQQVPFRGELHRIITILKLRFSDHDPALREFRIRSSEGLRVLGRVESASGVLEGITQDQEQAATHAQEGSRRASGRKAE